MKTPYISPFHDFIGIGDMELLKKWQAHYANLGIRTVTVTPTATARWQEGKMIRRLLVHYSDHVRVLKARNQETGPEDIDCIGGLIVLGDKSLVKEVVINNAKHRRKEAQQAI